jgi:hypothetical protein
MVSLIQWVDPVSSIFLEFFPENVYFAPYFSRNSANFVREMARGRGGNRYYKMGGEGVLRGKIKQEGRNSLITIPASLLRCFVILSEAKNPGKE